MKELTKLTISQAYQFLGKEISSYDLTKAYLEQISSLNPTINSYLNLNDQKALCVAEKSDRLRAKGETLCWLSGVPGAIKDVIVTRDLKTTAGSKILANFVPPYNATVIDKLESVYSPLLGKTNLDEFAMGSSNENSAFGPVANPFDLQRVPGGSSGGSAAAVSADMCAYALGSDTGGSIRQPSAFCGVVGLKPTYGLVSRYGLIAFASSLDVIGPITKTVEDAALVLNVIGGFDLNDSTSVKVELRDYQKNLTKGVKGLRIGLPKEYFIPGLAPEIKKAIQEALKVLDGLGAKVEEVSLPHTELALSVYYLIAPSEASSNLARFDGVRYGEERDKFGNEVKRRIILGTYALSAGYYEAYYLKAAKARSLVKKDFEKAFKKVDCLITPVTPSTAFKKGEKATPLEMYLADVFTIAVNLAGVPALSLPCGYSEGLPIGMQIIGPHFSEDKILQTGFAYEQASSWHERKPAL